MFKINDDGFLYCALSPKGYLLTFDNAEAIKLLNSGKDIVYGYHSDDTSEPKLSNAAFCVVSIDSENIAKIKFLNNAYGNSVITMLQSSEFPIRLTYNAVLNSKDSIETMEAFAFFYFVEDMPPVEEIPLPDSPFVIVQTLDNFDFASL